MILLPSQFEIDGVVESACQSLRERVHYDKGTNSFLPRICAICDCLHRVQNPVVKFPLERLLSNLRKYPCTRDKLPKDVPSTLANGFTAKDDRLKAFLLSPYTRVLPDSNNIECVEVCSRCVVEIEEQEKKPGPKSGPTFAIWNGSMFGDPPECLKVLNHAELNLVSVNRISIQTNAVVLRSDHHKGLVGWHSVFENDVEANAANVQCLQNAGVSGEFLCVLCGPFSKVHLKLAKKAYKVRPDKVLEAFHWLKENNPFYKDIKPPEDNELVSPRFLKHSSL